MKTVENSQPCPVCESPHLEVFFEMLAVPIYCNLLLLDREAALDCPKGDIRLAFCPECGFIPNVAFNPDRLEYTQEYENSLHYSPRFQEYADSFARSLVERYDLQDKTIVEIGCGKGDFLMSLCELGNNRGVGFDPTYVERSEHQHLIGQVRFVRDLYSERYAKENADFICCRHTLEHVPQPIDLLQPLRRAIGNQTDTQVFFEVPNALHTFRNLAVWDIIYEHCCYFAPTSLSRAFTQSGFEVNNLTETFGEQFLCLEAVPSGSSGETISSVQNEVKDLSRDIAAFTAKFDKLLETWQQKLNEMAREGKKAVVWGAGSKGVTFLNLLAAQEAIEYVVDINPRKQGMYVAGTGQKIVPPEFLPTHPPDVAIVMNPIYETEIRQILTDLGLECEVICV
ncbi:methyltransferase domain-containing protein [Oscillatoriales cyanobacterium LEGE 11467]|uniref:Methyltransferase domain-containing protein n=1 Tax=Zarconia navalis LEGE 11467 TaxID=1828826 RepID=A0A928W195_9CYAN|nr:class I SAM-dependent methyltransferase [Zarconia navalis]MBE9042677.1 methyltransferase domain-containing protein [Zarconia navalis LEGE 11467]